MCTLKFLADSHIRELQIILWHFNEDVDEHHLLKEAYAFLFGSPEAFVQNEKWRYLLRTMFNKQNLRQFVIVAGENIRKHAH